MVHGLRGLSAREIQDRYGLPPRWMQRLGAWRARRVDITASLLELAVGVEGQALGTRLLSPQLLPREGERLRPEDLGGPEETVELALLEQEGWQVLALAEEVLAAEGWGEAAGGGEAEPETVEARSLETVSEQPATLLSSAESAVLFSPQQVATLKLEILTGTDDAARRQALRRISLSDLSPQEKGILYLVALREGGDELRAEAATALGNLGMQQELVSAFRTHATGDLEARRLALGRLGRQGDATSSWEAMVVVSVLLSFLPRGNPELTVDVLRALGGYAGYLGQDEGLCGALLESLGALLVSRGEELAAVSVSLLHRVAAASPAEVTPLVLREAEGLGEQPPQRRARSLLRAGLCGVGVGQTDMARSLAEDLLTDLAWWDPLSVGLAQVESGLLELGEATLESVAQALVSADRVTRLEAVGLVECMVRLDRDPAFLRQAALTLAEALESVPTMVGSLIRRSTVFRDRDLDDATRREVAVRLIREAHLQPDLLLQEEVVEVFTSLGGAALDPIVDALTRVRRGADRLVYVEALSRASRGSPAAGVEPVERALDATLDLFHERTDPGPAGSLAAAVYGRLTCHPALPAARVREAFEHLRQALWRSALTGGAIEGLGQLATSPGAEVEDRVAVADLLLRLVRSRLPAAQGKERPAEEGHVQYDLDDTETYTSRLPPLIRSLRDLAVCALVPATIRSQVVEVLLERWQALVEFREIWGPANVASLAEALATIAGAPIAPPPPRLLLLEALGRQEGSLHVASLISLVAARLEEDPELEPFFSQFAIRLLELSREESIVEDPEDLEQVLGASARLLRRQELHDEAGRDLREELLATLLAGLRDRVPGVLGQLQRLREDEALPEAMRQTITRRLEALSR